MNLQELKKAKIRAIQECCKKKISIDVYNSNGSPKVKQTNLRNSDKFLFRMSYEKDAIKIENEKGKIETQKIVRKAEKQETKKESAKEGKK